MRSRPSASGTSTPICQKCGSSSRAVGPERRADDAVLALGQHPQPVAVQDLARALLDLLEVGGPRDEYVRDRERGVEREPRRVPARARPPPARSGGGCRPWRHSRRPRRRRCRRGGASCGGPRTPSRSHRAWRARPCGPPRRARRRPCPRRSRGASAAGRPGSTSRGRGAAQPARPHPARTASKNERSSILPGPRLLREGARRVRGMRNYSPRTGCAAARRAGETREGILIAICRKFTLLPGHRRLKRAEFQAG